MAASRKSRPSLAEFQVECTRRYHAATVSVLTEADEVFPARSFSFARQHACCKRFLTPLHHTGALFGWGGSAITRTSGACAGQRVRRSARNAGPCHVLVSAINSFALRGGTSRRPELLSEPVRLPLQVQWLGRCRCATARR